MIVSTGWLAALLICASLALSVTGCERRPETPLDSRVVTPATDPATERAIETIPSTAPASADGAPPVADDATDEDTTEPQTAAVATEEPFSSSDGERVVDAEANPLLQRVVLIGASLTQGFGTSVVIEPADEGALPTFVPISLGDALSASMRAPFRPVAAQGDLFFFMRPDRAGARLAAMAFDREPSLLVALDFLFWFGYGHLGPDETRVDRLRRGFAMLDRFTCPIIVADFPDLSEAVGGMISIEQLPNVEERAALNATLADWAEARGDTVVLPLAELLETLRSGGEVTVAGATWSTEESRGLLQADRMHATPAGMIAVIRQLLEEIARLDPTLGGATSLALDPDEAMAHLRSMARSRVSPQARVTPNGAASP